MCRIKGCKRHELWGTLCYDHLSDAADKDMLTALAEYQPTRKRTTKKVDAVELEVRKDDNDK